MTIPDGARRALTRQLADRRQQRWPDLTHLHIRYRGDFAYVAGATIDDADPQPLFRLRYVGSPNDWGFAIYLASKDGYEDPSSPPGDSSAPPPKPSTVPAVSTSTTSPRGPTPHPIHARTSDEKHLVSFHRSDRRAVPVIQGNGSGARRPR